jgi:hypothetical protein
MTADSVLGVRIEEKMEGITNMANIGLRSKNEKLKNLISAHSMHHLNNHARNDHLLKAVKAEFMNE